MLTKLQTALRDYAESVLLEERFVWDFPHEGLPPTVVSALQEGSPFEKNIALKNSLKSHLTSSGYPIEYWIIQTWGGIQGFKQNGKNDYRIRELYQQLGKKSFPNQLFDVISSLSKVASFYDPNQYSIYDSRAVFSLNWLLLKSGATQNFFHMPSGRNSKIAKYDMETIIRLKCGDKPGLFVENREAYFEYCHLLKTLSPSVWDDSERKIMPFYLEMLLFVLGPEEIVEDIEKSSTLDIRAAV